MPKLQLGLNGKWVQNLLQAFIQSILSTKENPLHHHTAIIIKIFIAVFVNMFAVISWDGKLTVDDSFWSSSRGRHSTRSLETMLCHSYPWQAEKQRNEAHSFWQWWPNPIFGEQKNIRINSNGVAMSIWTITRMILTNNFHIFTRPNWNFHIWVFWKVNIFNFLDPSVICISTNLQEAVKLALHDFL